MANDRFCCFRVHTIGVVLGWLGTISAVVSIVIIAFLLGYINKIVEEFIKNNPSKADYEQVRAAFLAILVVGLILVIIHLVASMLLIAGTVKNKHLLLLPWLFNGFLGLLYQIIAMMVVIIGGIHSMTAAGEIFKLIIPILFSFAIQLVFWCAIYKLFKVIRMQSSMEAQRLITGPTAPGYTRL